MSSARKIAVKVLTDINSKKAYSNISLNSAFDSAELSPEDKAFATALVYGVLDRMITLDFVLSEFIKTSLTRVKPFTLEVLRTALYQIMYMDKVPQSAAVNEAVNIIKKSKESFNASFVNGVLRNILRKGISLPESESIEDMAVRYSCPMWIIKSICDDYGIEETKKFLSSSLEKPPVTLRVNTLKTDTDSLIKMLENENIKAVKGKAPDSADILCGMDFKRNKAFKNGFFHIQDAVCQLSVSKLSPKSGERVLDMCAAPGGKSFTMAQIMENCGEILSCDLYENRVKLISDGAKRLGIDIIKPIVNDATVYNEDLGLFDAVLCDVPCSGLGVIGRKPEIKYKPQDDFSSLEEIQKKILMNADKYLKAGGRLVYSTCTVRKNENENVVKAFLDKYKGYELKYQHTFMPHKDKTDGFYFALLYKSR